MPKFRGDSEDWLDQDEASAQTRSGPRREKKFKKEIKPLELKETNAVVAEVFPKQCRVRLDTGGELLCGYRRATLFSFFTEDDKQRERSPVTVGDRVLAQEAAPGQGVVVNCAVRRNNLTRLAPSRYGTQIHAIAANLDAVVIVASLKKPDFSPGLVDRYLVACQAADIPTVLCVTKCDLDTTPEMESLFDTYRSVGVTVYQTSSKQQKGVDALKQFVHGKMVAFCGHSGVGKTSLLRVLTQDTEFGKVGAVSDSGKGMHTTTTSYLIPAGGNSNWIDTPGIREFGLSDVDPDDLHRYFPEFLEHTCPNHDCSHTFEQDCELKKLPRYSSFRRIYDSLQELQEELSR